MVLWPLEILSLFHLYNTKLQTNPANPELCEHEYRCRGITFTIGF